MLQEHDGRSVDVINTLNRVGAVKSSLRVPCSETVEFHIGVNVTYFVAVFVENKEHGVLGTHTFYLEEIITIFHEEDAVTSRNQTLNKSTSNSSICKYLIKLVYTNIVANS